MKRPVFPMLLASTIATLLAACGPTDRPCASDTDCLAAEACVLGAEGGRCTSRAPSAGGGSPETEPPSDPPSDPGDDPTEDAGTPDDPSDPVDEPTDPTDPSDPTDPTDPAPGAPRILRHGVVAGAGAARSATFRVTQQISSSPRRVLAGGALEVRN